MGGTAGRLGLVVLVVREQFAGSEPADALDLLQLIRGAVVEPLSAAVGLVGLVHLQQHAASGHAHDLAVRTLQLAVRLIESGPSPQPHVVARRQLRRLLVLDRTAGGNRLGVVHGHDRPSLPAAPGRGSRRRAHAPILQRMGITRMLGMLLAVSAAGLAAGATEPRAAPLPSAPACPMFPAGNVWNQDVSALPVAADSATLLSTIGLSTGLHPDFGSYAGYGIPINTVSGTRTRVKVRFGYSSQSDKGPYPIPRKPKIERSSDHHMLIVDRDHCTLFELWNVRHTF